MKITVTEQAVREFLSELMSGAGTGAGWNDPSTYAPDPVNVNAVVDPSAAYSDPGNDRFKPKNKAEFKMALGALLDDVDDVDSPDAFEAVKDAIGNFKGISGKDRNKMKKDDNKIEEAIRAAVRKLVMEAWVKDPKTGVEMWQDESPKKVKTTLPKKKGPATPGPVVGGLPPVKKIPAGVHGGEWMRQHKALAKDLRDTMKRMTLSDDEAPEEDLPPVRGKKNMMVGDVGGVGLKELAKELGFSGPSGVNQWTAKVLQKFKDRFAMLQQSPEEYQIMILEVMDQYINELVAAGAIDESEAQELRMGNPEHVAELDTFRVFLNKELAKRSRGKK